MRLLLFVAAAPFLAASAPAQEDGFGTPADLLNLNPPTQSIEQAPSRQAVSPVGPTTNAGRANPYQGVYAGKILVALANRGFKTEFCPSRMTVLPDGHSIVITTQIPSGVSSGVIRGSFNGNLFEGSEAGRINFQTYNYAANYTIRFLRNEARIEKIITPSRDKGHLVHQTVQIFYRVRS
jgi:hypothetical protein